VDNAIIDNEHTTIIGAGEPWFEAKDVAAFFMAAVMTLGPLAAATLFS
jgi:hypothetical protein